MQATADLGLIGLAVMGQNLVLNMDDHGFTVAVYNRTTSKVDDFLAGEARGTRVVGAHSIEELVASLKRPRRLMLMVKAGGPVDAMIEQLLPHLEPGDILIDGGNSNYQDTVRRVEELERKGLLFVGMGVSGGEEGARHGPSLMPGGSPAAWEAVKDLLQTIAAKAEDGIPCCEWMGEGGAGHFVKMVHNGIEYGDMQLIAEAYDLMRSRAGMEPSAMAQAFRGWNQGRLKSFLIEITGEILAYQEDGQPLVDRILDAAGQKGTGKWTGMNALDLGIPLTLITEAVFARSLSARKEERGRASQALRGNPPQAFHGDLDRFLVDLETTLYISKIVSYTQGYMLLDAARKEFGWSMNPGGIAMVWREGCIIRSAFLSRIKEAFDRHPDLENLLLDPFFRDEANAAQDSWRRIVGEAIADGVPVPAMASALTFYDGYRSERLPANLIQAQRDYFGAHTYERTDRPRGQVFHTNWTGHGGSVTAGTYSA